MATYVDGKSNTCYVNSDPRVENFDWSDQTKEPTKSC